MKLFALHTGGRHLLFAFLRGYWKLALITFLLDLFANVCVIGISLVLAQTIAATIGFNSVRGNLLFGAQNLDVTGLLSLLSGIIGIKLFLDYGRYRLRGYLSEIFAFQLRQLIFNQHLQTDLLYHELRNSGQNLLRFSGDLGSVQRLLTRGVFQFAADFMLILMGLCLITILGGVLTLFVLGIGLLGWGSIILCNRQLQRIERSRRNKKSSLLAFISSTLLNLGSIQALNRSTRTTQRFDRKAQKVRDLGHRYHSIAAISTALPAFFVQILLVLALAYGWRLGLAGQSLFAVVLVLMSWRTPLSRFLNTSLIWKKGWLSLERIDQLLQSPIAASGAQVLNKKNASNLSVNAVSLRIGDQTIFKNLDFELERGQELCLTAGIGGGKTSLTKLLAGLYTATSGRIALDECSAEKLTKNSLRRQFSFVSDAFPLVGETLLDAISPSGQPEALAASKVEIAFCKILFPSLQMLDFEQKLSLLMPTISTGQHRLLQCLRAHLTQKPFLILDEPFVGLDHATAKELTAFLKQNQRNKGILVLTGQPESLSALGWGEIATISFKKN